MSNPKGRFIDDICDLPYLQQSSLEAFCGLADLVNVSIVQHNQSQTDSVPQNNLSSTFDSVNSPVYDTAVLMAAVWDRKPRDEDIKKYGVTIDKDRTFINLMFNNLLLEQSNIVLHINDRVQITGVGLCEIISIHSDRDMGTLQFNTEVLAYLLD